MAAEAADLPIVLQPVVELPPARGSIFDDPGDEKSWRISQRGAGLTAHFAGRQPSWYASAIRPLEGVDSVLDLGSGLGLTLEALRAQGSTRVLGVDRWLTFMGRATPATPMIAHDLTLPMPFLRSGSFEGVFSHYVLEYMSPIGIRQALREALRILSPGGTLVAYVAGIGLGDMDIARTVPYTPAILRTLLGEAGFDEIEVEAPGDGRNSVVRARRSRGDRVRTGGSAEVVRASLGGDTQLSASFDGGGDRVVCELAGAGGKVALSFDLPPVPAGSTPDDARVSVCARSLTLPNGTELRVWVWRGTTPVVSECFRLELEAAELRVRCSGSVEHHAVWTPHEVSLEPVGDAYAWVPDLPPGIDLSPVERGAEGRKVVVERSGEGRADASRLLGEGRNRFLIRRAAGLEISELDREWAASQAHGVAFAATELAGGLERELLLWARWRQAPIFVDGAFWGRIVEAVSARLPELAGPVILVDPALGADRPAGPIPGEVVEFAGSADEIHVLLAGPSRDRSAREDLERVRGRILHGGPRGEDATGMLEANETLRYLTERVLLMQLRQWRPFSWAEVGRRPALGRG